MFRHSSFPKSESVCAPVLQGFHTTVVREFCFSSRIRRRSHRGRCLVIGRVQSEIQGRADGDGAACDRDAGRRIFSRVRLPANVGESVGFIEYVGCQRQPGDHFEFAGRHPGGRCGGRRARRLLAPDASASLVDQRRDVRIRDFGAFGERHR